MKGRDKSLHFLFTLLTVLDSGLLLNGNLREHEESCQFECKLATETKVAGAHRIGRFLRQDYEIYSEEPTRKN